MNQECNDRDIEIFKLLAEDIRIVEEYTSTKA